MLQVLMLALGALLLLLLGTLYLVDKRFVRMIARSPEAVDAPGGEMVRIFIGVVLILGAVLCGAGLWQAITM